MNTTIDERYIWLGGKILHVQDAKINVLAPTSQFGANVFEGIRCYWNSSEHQLYAFRLTEHYKRLRNSIKMFRMESNFSEEELKNALISVIKANEYYEDIAVRQTVFVDGFGTWSARGPINMFVAPIPKSRLDFTSVKPIKCCVSSWERISDKNLSPKVKVGANYINSRMAQLEALENGYDSAIFMNHLGKVAEGPGSCFFMVRDNALITPPCTASVLESITRDTILTIGKEIMGLQVCERDIDRTELYICDEAFLCGSAMEITPISNIDGFSIEFSHTGLTKRIHDAYISVVTGKIDRYKNWLTPIYE